ncbi:sulfate adenylyltransferase subunit 1 [Saccharothrix coeruleofusca]|uniref:sulfate adenylyltransferase subunit 1 n=1 Tax=Saccharothrix coeruleofusca TaxID=33919 RepID=UPI001AE99249|nr:GTP-binding protein [Saccharothrix coeruleofusca]MBP2334918.1 sulfate adenylyltransferase subunit 1 [Saccharothrix coeruleofusca]
MASDLLRLVTAGSVDDGKSTLVGRLLYDTKSVLSDQLDAVLRSSAERGLADPDLSLLVDGLRAEREQGITIDVAYRYFATSRRTFVLADTPGHVQYLRNTVTGASTADHAVLLTDARKGVLPQTRRHLAVMAMLGVPGITLAVNKLDLVDFDRGTFESTRDEFVAHATSLGYREEQVTAVPLSALAGDNVVAASDRTPWYDGPTLLEHLETVVPDRRGCDVGFRMPVQYVLRDGATDYRGYAGQVVAGEVSPGDPVVVLPDGATTTVVEVGTPDGPVDRAREGEPVTLVLADEVDITRGDLIASADRRPRVDDELDATVCWLADEPLRPGARVLLKHGTRTTTCRVLDLPTRFDEQELALEDGPQELSLNEIGRVRLQVADPLPADDYADCVATGAFLLIEPNDGNTLAAGLLGDALSVMASGGGARDD